MLGALARHRKLWLAVERFEPPQPADPASYSQDRHRPPAAGPTWFTIASMRLAPLMLAAILPLTLAACDDDPPKQERKSVVEGGKAESAPGKQLEGAKREIDEVEKVMQERADDNFEKTADEKVPRGL